jgi:hypothetical protein
MSLTIDDISEARRNDIETICRGITTTTTHVLVAVAYELEMWERKDMCNALNWERYQAVLQVWEQAYEAAGGVVKSTREGVAA